MINTNNNLNQKRMSDLGLQFDCSDIGNMDRFITKHRKCLRYVADQKCWVHWNGRFWELNAKEVAYKKALETINAIYDEISVCPKESGAAELRRWAYCSRTRAKVSSILSMASQHPDMVCQSDEFDNSPYLLNCQNGVVDLRDGSLQFHSSDLMLTQITAVDYVSGKKAPRFEKFIADIFCDDKSLIAWMKRALGYSLTGKCSEQCIFIAYGSGANGKSTLFETIKSLLGSYAISSEFDTFLVKDNANVRSLEGIGKLKGKRFSSASETDNHRSFSEALIKRITGEDTIVGAALYGSSYEFRPTHKIWLLANHLPNVKDHSIGFWRRIKVIPFDRTFKSCEMDLTLSNNLALEAEGILSWIVDGAIEWFKLHKTKTGGTGLGDCEKIDQSTEIYQMESDVFGMFLSQKTVNKVGEEISASKLYSTYLRWCNEDDHTLPGSQREFGSYLEKTGLKKKRKNDGYYYQDITLPELSMDKEL